MNMKLIALAGVLCAGLLTAAARIEAGPKGGRILEKTTPKAEFFVEKDRTVSITFYDAGGKVVAPTGQTAKVIAEAKSGKQTLKLEKAGDALVSTMNLPEGDGYNIVVQLKQTPEAKPQNFRFTYDASICGGCKRAEYACTCHS